MAEGFGNGNGLSPQSANLQRANQAYSRQLFDCMEYLCQQPKGPGGNAAIVQVVRQFDISGAHQNERQAHFTANEKDHPALINELDAPRRLYKQVKQAIDG